MESDLFGYTIKINKNAVCMYCRYLFAVHGYDKKTRYYCKCFKDPLNEVGFKQMHAKKQACCLYEERGKENAE